MIASLLVFAGVSAVVIMMPGPGHRGDHRQHDAVTGAALTASGLRLAGEQR